MIDVIHIQFTSMQNSLDPHHIEFTSMQNQQVNLHIRNHIRVTSEITSMQNPFTSRSPPYMRALQALLDPCASID